MNEPAASPRVVLQVAVANDDVPQEDQCAAWVAAALANAAPDGDVPVTGSVTVRLVDEQESATLNATYRHRDGPTNVLAFPGPAHTLPGTAEAAELGDLVVCWPLTCREAAQQGKTAQDHCAHLVVHGTLHLIGYDHERAEEAERMERLETRVLDTLGIDNPYAPGD